MKQKLLTLLLALCLALTPLTPALAAEAPARDLSRETDMASGLKALGLFRGVSDYDFALDRAPTRAEALVMLLRLLGLESEALQENAAHPFTDTVFCRWADPYIGYAYSHGITAGLDAATFGGGAAADARTYLTFMLRALGYTEGPDGDFLWSAPYTLAKDIGLLPAQLRLSSFLRADAVTVSYAALAAPCKGETQTLGEKLVADGVVSAESFSDYYDPFAVQTGTVDETVAANVARFMRPYVTRGGIDISTLPISAKGGVLLIGDAGYEQYGFYARGAKMCAEQIGAAADALAGKARVFGIVVPNRLGAVLSYDDFDRLSSSSKNESEAIAYAYSNMGENTLCVDAVSNLRLHNDEYIFFRTDHHWTALGAYYAYEAWAETAGLTPAKLDSFSTLDMPGHLGLFYGMCGNPAVMKQNPDTVTAYIPSGNFSVDIYESATPRSGQLIYDYTNSAYKYGAFIGGDHPLTAITNHDIPDDSACVLVKDSYGNPFAVYLAQHYRTVYVVDYRYYKNLSGYRTFTQFADELGVDDFIVLLPMTLSQSEVTAGHLSRYCK